MLGNLLAKVFGTQNERDLKRLRPTVEQINALEASVSALTDDGLRGKTAEFKARLANGETLDDLLPEAFAVVREAGRRVLNMRHFDVQLIGGMVLHRGKIAEMKTGEGKTLVATLPAYLNALAGKGVHVVTVNDYLARATPSGWAASTASSASPSASSSTTSTTRSARSPTPATSPTAPTTSSASTTCATT